MLCLGRDRTRSLWLSARGAPVQDVSVDWGIPEIDSATEKVEDDFELVEKYSPAPTPISLFDDAAIPGVKAEKATWDLMLVQSSFHCLPASK